MYGKIFDSMYDGTLAEDWRALITFQQMIVLCDADGVIDMTPSAISRRTGIPIEHIKAGIEILESPDPYTRTPGHDGVRIELIDEHRPWGWVIVNHAKYKAMQDADTVRAQTRERVRRHREKKRGVTDGNGQKRHTDTDTYTDKHPEGALANANGSPNRVLQRGVRTCPKWFTVTDDLQRYAESRLPADLVSTEVEKFRNHEFARPRRDWEATFRNWILKAAERQPKAMDPELRRMAEFND